MESFCSQAYTSDGLVSLNKKASDVSFTYILKGYPVSLKHLFLKSVLESSYSHCEAAYGYNNSLIYISCGEKDFQIIDGTYPNTLEPETYGITDSVIDLSSFQDMRYLGRSKEKAVRLFNEIKKEEKRCTGFISAARSITESCRRQDSGYIITPALNRFSARLWKRHGISPSGRVGRETKYFADYLTGSGSCFNFEKFSSMCETVSIINDFSSAVSTSVADKIRLYALSCGLDVISFVDFLDAKTVLHIIIPELKFGIYSARFPDTVNMEGTKKIRKNRFFRQEYSDYIKNKTAFCKRAYSELTEEAVKSIKRIDILKNELDKIYLEVTDSDAFICKNKLKVAGIDKSLQKVYNI